MEEKTADVVTGWKKLANRFAIHNRLLLMQFQ
jgi:hypothetical protein